MKPTPCALHPLAIASCQFLQELHLKEREKERKLAAEQYGLTP